MAALARRWLAGRALAGRRSGAGRRRWRGAGRRCSHSRVGASIKQKKVPTEQGRNLALRKETNHLLFKGFFGVFVRKWQGRDYDSPALPLSYPAATHRGGFRLPCRWASSRLASRVKPSGQGRRQGTRVRFPPRKRVCGRAGRGAVADVADGLSRTHDAHGR